MSVTQQSKKIHLFFTNYSTLFFIIFKDRVTRFLTHVFFMNLNHLGSLFIYFNIFEYAFDFVDQFAFKQRSPRCHRCVRHWHRTLKLHYDTAESNLCMYFFKVFILLNKSHVIFDPVISYFKLTWYNGSWAEIFGMYTVGAIFKNN